MGAVVTEEGPTEAATEEVEAAWVAMAAAMVEVRVASFACGGVDGRVSLCVCLCMCLRVFACVCMCMRVRAGVCGCVDGYAHACT
mmetsp:Transcript_27832/g.71055  ORF Transcript_27832/g.71055 Transcript_27832/m.71055 type:complete len:85 (-) Transcript_27832:328-582(-)